MNDTPRHARIHWDEHGLPVSTAFDDVYFSKESGLAETLHNFIDQNRLCERWRALPAGACFVVGETGFGTGLNFFCAWQLFEQHAPADARLHFVSVEKYPLSRADLARAVALWPQLALYGQQLLGQYLVLQPGFQRVVFAAGRVTLTLLVGDVIEQLAALDAMVDAWFLDGFAPAKNPEMWTPGLFAQLARLSAPGATLGTFTAAGVVRRGLMAEGFDMFRVPGFGRKREVMRGVYTGAPQPVSGPWFNRPPTPHGERRAVVIGAGLAGCASAASLAARGWRVTVLDRAGGLAQGASGNPQGVLYLKLSAHGTALSRLIVSGFGYIRRQLEHLPQGQAWDACGVLQLAFDEKERNRQAALAQAFDSDLVQALAQDAASIQAGVGVPSGGLYFPDAGWVHPAALCRWWMDHPAIEFRPYCQVSALERDAGAWRLFDGERCLEQAPVVIVANAEDAARLTGLPLKPIRGQVTYLPANRPSGALRTVLCAEGYIAPPRLGEHTLGASFDFTATGLQPTNAEHAGNLARLAQISPELAGAWALQPAELSGRASLRCTTPDYLPVIGPLSEAHGNEQPGGSAAPRWREGLYVNSGHGSRGLVTAPLAGELLAAWLEGEPLPLPRDVAHACHPDRFLMRQLKKRRVHS
ncbi:bifunctional tRNA (5-methylaminomethyl-2-thiouridine)(34)-methyltransferase MnmD/FAD-dependent 5-carboxymethylaminomethyl-2-thiouridine(34) oxidoreductase MnmC [Pseudomonas typographi]|uniref:tRNA 5-methylaminomethyl-2-thiouridine biosynthesis bifunctional protein MnmC n=1 Tax=Pseudomonas typographi TaxID=2715964 RepID=A0ABR7Z063_9PSED|nr:bifunctional tRNA (5-methylaminomethyl-2-thiouridine)(34)-methyltransferase MnmD/FAD-dependent 5-carboxymethylaminomethyl-2-thiouridine(34) oxidoreductase MnmC [Pseudomonas typographi]MBD1598822.1 bifunctional tRNA (5-methylaminomethyl-2-thiouridine)(34)-methyltransferase MnmD/FAD-dependent 5-carboxymethylaminomethyl-2-thiouridine(34) oxidoreductase MnmC [Pseudomonas typographi]